jgi:hypothetical protein
MAVKVKDSLTKEGANFKKTLEELNRLKVMIGLQQGQKNQDGTDLVDIALFNELGTENIPSRPFLRNSVDNHSDEINSFLREKRNDLIHGASAKQVLNEIGLFQKNLIQSEIIDGSFEANAESTIKKKGSSRPLIDTGRMRQSVNYVVQKKGKGK